MSRYLVFTILIFVAFNGLRGQMLFDVELPDLDGNNITIESIKGEKLTIFDFWATWCGPCVNSIPKLVNLSDKFREKGVRFIGINEDSPRNQSKVRPFATSMGITYDVLLDKDQLLQSIFLIDGFPTLIITDAKGKIVFTHLGFINGDEIIIEETIQKLLDEKD